MQHAIRVAALFVLLAFGAIPAHAQSFSIVELPGGCGTGNITSNSLSYLTVDSGLKLCVNATATLGGFTATATGTPISVTTGGVSGTLPAGAEVVATNVGTTNGAYCALGASATTSSQYIAPNGGWFAFAVGASTQLTCITSTSTTTVNTTGGSGLPTGTGGGGGGGGGGTVTQGPTGTNAAAWWMQIGDTTNGPVAVATAGADAVSNTQNGLAGYARNEVFNGTTWDRLRSGTTLGSALINGAGTAGTAAGGILTVQGVASMTPLLVNGSAVTQPVSGPTAVGSANANPPVVMGGTATGAAGQNVEGVAVKPASTAPLATDLSMVVTESPNSPLLTSASTCLAGTAYNTNSAITSGQVGGANCDVNGAWYTNMSKWGGSVVLSGTGAGGAGAPRVTPSTDTSAGIAPVNGSAPVINGGNTYNTIAASQSTQALTGGSGGATGDYLSHCVVQPTTTAAGTVTIFDNSTSVFVFTTGTLSNLVPFAIPIGARSVSGAWKVTTGANETVTCVGKFT